MLSTFQGLTLMAPLRLGEHPTNSEMTSMDALCSADMSCRQVPKQNQKLLAEEAHTAIQGALHNSKQTAHTSSTLQQYVADRCRHQLKKVVPGRCIRLTQADASA